MKSRLLIGCLGVILALSTQGGIIYSPANNINAPIPDGTAVGWSGTASASGYRSSISSVSVNLNISGGYNGDLYAYLSYGGVLVPMLSRVGTTSSDPFGYGNAGFDITLSSSGAQNVHSYGSYSPSFNGSGQLTGTWQPDGRALDPSTSLPTSYPPGDSPVSFGLFNGLNPNGTWTLFIADLSAGAQSQLVSWSLDITAVPEPTNVALGIFGVIAGAITLGTSRQVRNLLRRALAN